MNLYINFKRGECKMGFDLESIGMEDIPESFRDIIEVVGMECFCKIVRSFGGMSLYIPREDSLLKPIRDRKIRDSKSSDYRQLCREFRLSESHVRKILRERDRGR